MTEQDKTASRHLLPENRPAAEAARVEKSRTLESVFQSAPYIMMLVDEDLRVADINRSGLRFTGMSKDNLLGRLCGDVIDCQNSFHPEGCGESELCPFCSLRSRVTRTFKTGEPLYEDHIRLNIVENGSVEAMDFLISTTRLETSPGRQVLVTLADITRRMRAEEALRRSEEKYRMLFEKMMNGFALHEIICDPLENPIDYRFLAVNPAFEKMTGLKAENIIGRTVREVLPNIENSWIDAYANVALDGKPADFENYSEELKKYFKITAFQPNPRQFACIFADITEHKQDEADKSRYEARLQQAQKMEAIGSLAGGIAHDLNNILFPITGLSEMLLSEIPPESPGYESIEQIYKSALRGSDLVKQILAFSRQSQTRKLPIRIQPVLKETVKLVRATIPMNIGITSSISPECGMVSADPTQIHQIMMNLITNAYHAVEHNNGTIHIELKAVALEKDTLLFDGVPCGRYARITVADTGAGIREDLMDKIFTPYFTTKEQGKGTGLGLSVVHGIVRQHGGDIQVFSKAGKGTAFHVYLPILEKNPDKDAVSTMRVLPRGSEHILIVDDEAPIVALEQTILQNLGYRITTRTGSLDALAAFKADPSRFDLVISDRSMPNMTGEQLSRELLSIRPDIPIILCTGFSNENDEQNARAMGIKGFLMKPVGAGDLAEMIRKVLDA